MKNCNYSCGFSSYSYDIEITSEVTGRAPTPELTIGVKQSGKDYYIHRCSTFYKHLDSYIDSSKILNFIYQL